VVSHLSAAQSVAAGLRPPPDPAARDPFAATQAAWRFYANPHVALPQLIGPPLACAAAGVARDCDAYALVALDWCPLHFGGHASKADRVPLAHAKDLGYELLTALAVGDRDGSPIAPLCLELRAADGVHSTRSGRLLPARSSLDALAPVMGHVAGRPGLGGRTPVFIIDREADSVGHYRRWDKETRLFVVRADDRPRVVHDDDDGEGDDGEADEGGEGGEGDEGEGEQLPLGEVADRLKRRRGGGAFVEVTGRDVWFRGTPARQFVAETTVVLRRPARTHRVDKRSGRARHRNVRGRPITPRLVVSEIREPAAGGAVLARWLLLTNLAASAVAAATVAPWYYWRWRIESYHKLLKGAGQQVEQWQQETAAAPARRLLVAAMACAVVWRLARDDRPQAAAMRDVLVRLSGRQMRRGKAARGFTEPARCWPGSACCCRCSNCPNSMTPGNCAPWPRPRCPASCDATAGDLCR
jgi:hypothetical protein